VLALPAVAGVDIGVDIGLDFAPVLWVGRLRQGVDVPIPGAGVEFFRAALEPAHGRLTVAHDACRRPAVIGKDVLEFARKFAAGHYALDHAFQTALADVAGPALEDVERQLGNDACQARQSLWMSCSYSATVADEIITVFLSTSAATRAARQ
jgi:hypothetical protein